MANKFYGSDEGGYEESGNWNIAEPFAMYRVMRPLRLFSELLTIAEFGTIDLSEEFIISDEVKAQARIKALKRMVACLKELCGNEFAINKKRDKGILPLYKKLLEERGPIWISKCYQTNTKRTSNGFKNVLVINEDSLEVTLRLLTNIQDKIASILNKSGLIFAVQDFKTVEDFKKELEHRIINQG